MKGKLCGAKTRAGTPCKRLARQPQGRCRLHGGCSLRGMAHPNFKDGHRSKYVGFLRHLRHLVPQPPTEE
jgi:hypothetical protein